MKWFLFLCVMVVNGFAFAQGNSMNFSAIDYHVQFVDASTPDSLAQKLTARYRNELEKARAVYSWIAQHISYNTGIYGGRAMATAHTYEQEDDSVEWKTGDEMTA